MVNPIQPAILQSNPRIPMTGIFDKGLSLVGTCHVLGTVRVYICCLLVSDRLSVNVIQDNYQDLFFSAVYAIW